MTQNRDRKRKIRARMAATGEPYTEAARHVGEDAGPPLAADSTGEHLAWSGPDWYAFPPEPPQGTAFGLGNGRNQRYYWEARRRWAPWQVRQHARMATELTEAAPGTWPTGTRGMGAVSRRYPRSGPGTAVRHHAARLARPRAGPRQAGRADRRR